MSEHSQSTTYQVTVVAAWTVPGVEDVEQGIQEVIGRLSDQVRRRNLKATVEPAPPTCPSCGEERPPGAIIADVAFVPIELTAEIDSTHGPDHAQETVLSALGPLLGDAKVTDTRTTAQT